MATQKELKTARASTREAKAEAKETLALVPVGTALGVGATFAAPALATRPVGAVAAGVAVLSAFKRYPMRPLVVGTCVGLLVPHVQTAMALLINRLRNG